MTKKEFVITFGNKQQIERVGSILTNFSNDYLPDAYLLINAR